MFITGIGIAGAHRAQRRVYSSLLCFLRLLCFSGLRELSLHRVFEGVALLHSAILASKLPQVFAATALEPILLANHYGRVLFEVGLLLGLCLGFRLDALLAGRSQFVAAHADRRSSHVTINELVVRVSLVSLAVYALATTSTCFGRSRSRSCRDTEWIRRIHRVALRLLVSCQVFVGLPEDFLLPLLHTCLVFGATTMARHADAAASASHAWAVARHSARCAPLAGISTGIEVHDATGVDLSVTCYNITCVRFRCVTAAKLVLI